MKTADFNHDLSFSREHSDDDEDVLARLLPEFIAVRTLDWQDRRGADYFCTRCTPDGEAAGVAVDVKRRRAGARRYWKSSTPEVPIELGASGWLFKPRSLAGLIVFAFDESDSDFDYAVAADELRRVATEKESEWRERFPVKRQRNQRDGRYYDSGDVLFIPVDELEAAGVKVHKIRKEISYG